MDPISPRDASAIPARLASGDRLLPLIGAAGAGAALMYLFDPARGARRRRLVTDQVVHAGHVVGDALGVTGRDLANRGRGLAAEARQHIKSDEADDVVITERVRAELGRAVSHPGAIDVSAQEGRVTLGGPVLAHEADNLVARVRRIRGVADVEDQLERHESAADVPALQGGAQLPRGEFELMQKNWTPGARLLTAVAGGALALYGMRRRDAVGSTLGLAGLALFARGSTNEDLGRLVGLSGGRSAVDVQKTINVNAPVADVFAYFTDWEHFPQWMSHVREVRASGPRGALGERTHWVVDGPAGATVEWDAETTRFEPEALVAWKSVDGAAIRQAGIIRFDRTGDAATRVSVRMTYNPPGGAAGHAVATLFGRDPKRQMDDDLARLKTMIETGTPPRDAASAMSAG